MICELLSTQTLFVRWHRAYSGAQETRPLPKILNVNFFDLLVSHGRRQGVYEAGSRLVDIFSNSCEQTLMVSLRSSLSFQGKTLRKFQFEVC